MKPCAKYCVSTHWCLRHCKLNTCWAYVFHVSYISGPRVLPSMCQSGCQGPLWTWRSVCTTDSTRTPSLSTRGEPSGCRSVMPGASTHWLWTASLLGWQRTGQLLRLWTLKKVTLNIQEIPVLSRHWEEPGRVKGRDLAEDRGRDRRHPKHGTSQPYILTFSLVSPTLALCPQDAQRITLQCIRPEFVESISVAVAETRLLYASGTRLGKGLSAFKNIKHSSNSENR